MSNYCEPLLLAFKDCLLHSDCVVKQGNLPSTCAKEHFDELPEQCRSLRMATYECKRGMLDMRKRFRGNNAAAVAPGFAQPTTSGSPPPPETSSVEGPSPAS